MQFNPFSDIYNEYGELRPSFFDKLKDTFIVFWGDPFAGFYRYSYIKEETKLGIFDYFTLGIAYLSFLIIYRVVAAPGRPIEKVMRTLLFIFFPIPVLSALVAGVSVVLRILTSCLLTFISIPMVTLVHFISNGLIRRDVKEYIDGCIQNCTGNSLIIDIPNL